MLSDGRSRRRLVGTAVDAFGKYSTTRTQRTRNLMCSDLCIIASLMEWIGNQLLNSRCPNPIP